MILKWFDTEAVDKFMDKAVEEFIAGFPPAELQDQRRKSPARLKRASDHLFASTSTFIAAHSLNLFQKARLGNKFKWALKSAGYPEEFVDQMTYELTARVATKTARKK